jgi:membrane protein
MGTYLTVFKRALSSFSDHNDTSFAAAIAYNAIFSIFPIILLAVAFLGFFLHDPAQREGVVNSLFKVLGDNISKDALRAQVTAVAGGSAGLGIVGIIAAGWSATGVFGEIRTALNIVWGVNKFRPIVQQKALDLAMLLSVGLLILLSIVVTGVLTAFEHFGSQLLGDSIGPVLHVLFAIAYVVVPTAISFIAFSLLYWLVPHAEIRIKDVWLGALAAAVAFEIVQLVFAFYVANFSHYSQSYGALGGIIAFLFFVYIAGCIILFGGEVSKEHIDVLAGVKDEAESEQPAPPQSLPERALGAVKGLVVDDSPHHDTSLPYEPGRKEPEQPSAPLVTDKQSGSEVKQFERDKTAAGSNPSPDGNGRDGKPPSRS